MYVRMYLNTSKCTDFENKKMTKLMFRLLCENFDLKTTRYMVKMYINSFYKFKDISALCSYILIAYRS